MIIELTAAALCAPIDALRGGQFVDRLHVHNKVWTAVYGLLIAAIFGHLTDWLGGAIILAFALGESSGWGTPMGSALFGTAMRQDKLEWWQFGPLKRDPFAALMFRGAMWGAPVAALATFDIRLLAVLPIFAVSMPVAVLIARRFDAEPGLKWSYQERIRGAIVGALCMGATL